MKHVLKMGSLIGFTWLLCVSVLVHGMQGGKGHGNDVWVRTFDNQVVSVPRWNIGQMKLLQELYLLQQNTRQGKKSVELTKNSEYNPIVVTTITKNELILLNQAFNAIAEGKFSEFYRPMKDEFDRSITNKAIGKGALRVLTNAAENVGATSLSAMLGALLLPDDIQAVMMPQIMEPIVHFIQGEAIEGKWLMGHTGPYNDVTCVAFSPDGKYIVSGSGSKGNNQYDRLIIWDDITGKPIHKLNDLYKHDAGNGKKVNCVAFSNNSKYLLSGSATYDSLFLWDVISGEKLRTFEGKKIATCVAFDKNNKYVVAGFDSKAKTQANLCLWDIVDISGKKIAIDDEHVLSGHPGPVKCVAFNPAGTMLASGSKGDNNNLILWDLNNNNEKIILEGHTKSVDFVAFSPSGDYLISGSKDAINNTFFLWDVKTEKQLRKFDEYRFACAAFGPKDDIVVLGEHSSLYLWDNIVSGEPKALIGHKGDMKCVSFSPDGNYIISGSTGKDYTENDDKYDLILWNGLTGEKIKSLKAHEKDVTCVAFNHDSTKIVSGSNCYDNKQNLGLWTLCSQDILNFIKTKLNLSQARFLYRLYLAEQNNNSVKLYTNDPDYSAYMKLKPNIRDIIQRVFPDAQQTPELGEKFAQITPTFLEQLKKQKEQQKVVSSVENDLRVLLKQAENDSSTIYKAIMKQLRIDAVFQPIVIDQLSPELIETYRDIGQKAVQ